MESNPLVLVKHHKSLMLQQETGSLGSFKENGKILFVYIFRILYSELQIHSSDRDLNSLVKKTDLGFISSVLFSSQFRHSFFSPLVKLYLRLVLNFLHFD